jgi:hypothetical protein
LNVNDRNDLLKHILNELSKDFDELGAEGASAKGKEKATYANSRNALAKSMNEIIAHIYDPKYIALSPEAKKKGLARIMQAYKEKEDKEKLEAQNQTEKRQLMTYKVGKPGKKTTVFSKQFEDLARESSGKRTKRGLIVK